MKIVHAYPPNIDAITAVFPNARQHGVIFTYGDTIFVPSGGEVSPWLKAHEGVHYSRQTTNGMTPAAWWERYLVDAAFRLGEELPAHRAEYRAYCAMRRDRNLRSAALNGMAARLAGPLYGGLLKHRDAIMEIAK